MNEPEANKKTEGQESIETGEMQTLKDWKRCQGWWCTPLIPELEAEAGGSLSSRTTWSIEQFQDTHDSFIQRNPVSKTKQTNKKQQQKKNQANKETNKKKLFVFSLDLVM